VTLHANSITGALCKKTRSKVRKLRRERERSVSTASQTMTEPEKSSDLGEISAVTVHFGTLPADSSVGLHIFSHV